MIKNSLSKLVLILVFFVTFTSTITIGFSFYDQTEQTVESSLTLGEWLIEQGIEYYFTTTTINDLINDGALTDRWSTYAIDQNQLITTRTSGELFIPYTQDEYTISVVGSLDEGTKGGYGIFFETTLNNDNPNEDTGYILQFDRQYAGGTLLIRERVLGSETSPIWQIRGSKTTLFPTVHEDPIWWSSNHQIDLTIQRLNDTTKTVTIFIDQVEIDTVEITANNSDTLYTGFRNWRANTTFDSITII